MTIQYYGVIIILLKIIYCSVPIGVPGATSGSMFTPIPVEVTAYDPEVTGLDLLHKTKTNKLRQVAPSPDLARVSEGIEKLELMLNTVIQVMFMIFQLITEHYIRFLF